MLLKKSISPKNFSVGSSVGVSSNSVKKENTGKSSVKNTKKVSNTGESSVKSESRGDKTTLGVIGQHYMSVGEDMRGLFFIIKGNYVRNLGDSFLNEVSGDVSHIGGYDPEGENTKEWYMCLDKVTFQCVTCGNDIEKVLRGVKDYIVKFRGKSKDYFKYICDLTSEDYYETHFLGRPPLTPEKRTKKALGRCPRTSPIMRCLYNAVFEVYGQYYRDKIEAVEEEAYKVVEKRNTPLKKVLKVKR